jgi:O-antigen/teichoic acid export membrane protein
VGFIQKDSLSSMILSYFGLVLGYINKGVLFVLILSTEQIGLINILTSTGFLFAQISNLGMFNAVIRFLPYFKSSSIYRSKLFKFSFLTVGFGVIFFLFVLFIIEDRFIDFFQGKSKLLVDNFYWILPIGISNVIYLLLESFLRGYHKNLVSVYANDLFLRIFTTILLLFYWFEFVDFKAFVSIYSFLFFIPTIFLLIYVLRFETGVSKESIVKFSSKMKRIIFNYSIFNYANSVGLIVVITMDSLMITYYLGLKFTGIYTTIMYLISALQVPYRSLYRVSEPLVPKLWREKRFEELHLLYKKISSISLVIILFLFSLVWINRNEIFSLLPNEYSLGIEVFLYLMLGKIVDVYMGINGIILLSSKKYKYDVYFTFILLFLVYSLNVILIPLIGINGAAISTSMATVVYNIGRMLIVWKNYKLNPFEIKQLYVLLLFILSLFCFEIFPPFCQGETLSIVLKSTIMTLFLSAILFYFNLNDEIKEFINRNLFQKFKFK